MTTVTSETPRSATVAPTVRTKSATVARQRKAAERAALRLGVDQLGHLPDAHLKALTRSLIGEMHRRGLRFDDDE